MRIQTAEEFAKVNSFGLGQANTAFAKYFIGDSFLNPLTAPGESAVGLANVTFAPGCRNNWHIHHAKRGGGQILICTAGSGWYQEAGKAAVSLEPGAVIVIPPGGQALARREEGQLVCPHRLRPARRGRFQRMAGAGDGRGVRQAVKGAHKKRPPDTRRTACLCIATRRR